MTELQDATLALQRELVRRGYKLEGADGGIDGVAGKSTIKAALQALTISIVHGGTTGTMTLTPQDLAGDKQEVPIDAHSERFINGLQPVFQPLARQLVRDCLNNGLNARIISGYRSDEEQDALYNQGRTKPGKIVTNARAGYSNHNYGFAIDIGLFTADGKYYDDLVEAGMMSAAACSAAYKKVAVLGKSLGLLWGGDWSNDDEPHHEFRPDYAKDMTENEALAEYRSRKRQGVALV